MEIYATILVCILVAMPLFFILYGAGLVVYYNWKSDRAHKKHPDYFEFEEEVQKLENEIWDWEKVINEKKKVIDEILNQIKYVPTEDHKKWEDKMEEIRKEIAVLLDEELRPREIEYLALKDRLKAWKKKLIEDKEIVEW